MYTENRARSTSVMMRMCSLISWSPYKSRKSRGLQNAHPQRQWLPHSSEISFLRARFWDLGIGRSHKELNQKSRMDGVVIWTLFCAILPIRLQSCGLMRCHGRRWLFCAQILVVSFAALRSNESDVLHNMLLWWFDIFVNSFYDNYWHAHFKSMPNVN